MHLPVGEFDQAELEVNFELIFEEKQKGNLSLKF